MTTKRRLNPFPLGMSAYVLLLEVTVACVASAYLVHSPGLSPWPAVAGLAIIGAAAERGRVRFTSKIEISISPIPIVFAAAVFGPLAALIVGGCSFAGEFPPLLSGARRRSLATKRSPYLRWRLYTATRALSGMAAAFAAIDLSKQVGTGPGGTILTIAATATVVQLLDAIFASITGAVIGASAFAILKTVIPMAAASVMVYTPLLALLAIAYREVSPLTIAFFFVPALAAQRLFALYQSQRELAEGLSELNTRLEQANLSFASALIATLDARDRYTAGHSAAVAIYARDIAARLELSEQQQHLAHLCGLVHDIGKIGLPAGLLEKPGALTLDERREMQRHSTIGERILANVETYKEIADVVRHHHERLDGHGYPDGIGGDEIPLLARIIAVADAYNAMTSDRPYRDAMPTRVARLRLAQAADSQFDTDVVAAFEGILATASDEYLKATGAEFLWLHDRRTESDEAASALRLAN